MFEAGIAVTALVVRAHARACAIPIGYVVETMRRWPVAPLEGMPRFVLGVSVIRGAPTPVLDLGTLLDGGGETEASATSARFVTVTTGPRRFALAVDAVAGVRELNSGKLEALPRFMEGAARGAIEAVIAEDAELVVLLAAMRLVPDELSAALFRAEAPR